MSVYFFWGDEDYLIDKELNKFRSKLDESFSEMNYVVYDSLEISELIAVIRTQPMMFGKMMIVINTHKLLLDKGTKRQSILNAPLDDNQINEIESGLDGVEEINKDMIDIFFVEKYDENDKTKKPDSRRKIFKVLSKYNQKEFSKIATYRTEELANVIKGIAKEKKIKLEPDTIEELIARKGNDIRSFDIELDKLATYAYPETTITKKMVEEICSSKEDLFNLTEYITSQKKAEALAEIRSLLATKHPLEVIAPLQTLLKQWIYVKLNMGKLTNKEIATKLRFGNENRVWVISKQVKNVPIKVFTELRQKLTQAEYNIKTGLAYSPEEELENAIIR